MNTKNRFVTLVLTSSFLMLPAVYLHAEESSLQSKLAGLKEAYESNLITEKEYSEARAKAIASFTSKPAEKSWFAGCWRVNKGVTDGALSDDSGIGGVIDTVNTFTTETYWKIRVDGKTVTVAEVTKPLMWGSKTESEKLALRATGDGKHEQNLSVSDVKIEEGSITFTASQKFPDGAGGASATYTLTKSSGDQVEGISHEQLKNFNMFGESSVVSDETTKLTLVRVTEEQYAK